LDSKKVFYELRMTDTLAMGNDRPSANSTRGGEALYCAANQNKFWEYFYRMLEKIQSDYYDKGLGGYHGAPEIPIIDDSFFYDGAKDVGIDVAKLTSCISDGTGLKSLRQATDSALKWNRDSNGKAQGLPAIFVNNKFVTAGFGEGGYPDFRKTLVAAGIK
jgi:protein-disulfide isomerase